jgi:DNA transformation protein
VSVAAARSLALDIAEHLRGAGDIAVRRFFGGAALVIDGLQVGFVMKGSVYLRVDDGSRPVFEALGALPFTYGSAGRSVTVARYYETPAEIVDDPERLRDWAKEARRAASAEVTGIGRKRRGAKARRNRGTSSPS